MKKILFTASSVGHIGSFHLPYLRAFLSNGASVTVAASGEPSVLPEGVRFLPLPFCKSFFALSNFRASLLLAHELRKNSYDTVLCHTSLAAFFTRLGVVLSLRRGVRVVNTVHGYLFDENSSPLRRFVLLTAEKLCRGVTSDIVTMNRQDTNLAREKRLCRGEVRFTDGMGVELSRFAPAEAAAKAAAREALSLPPDALVFLCAAEFSPRKNQAFLLRALARLPEDVFLLLPGDGELLSDCRSLAGELGVASRVRFPGKVADVRPYLAAADACVSASRIEGLPFHAMEAMASGLPCILSRVKGHEDLVSDGACGLLYPFGDTDGFLHAVETFRSSPELRETLSRHALDSMEKRSLDRILPVLTEFYLK